MRVFFDRQLDTAATFWRVYRRDGVALGFTSHDRALAFGGIVHRSAPGMIPAAIRMTSDLSEDSAGVEGALTHDSIRAEDLTDGLFDGAAIEVGIVDWKELTHRTIYTGTIGRIEDNTRGFSAELRSAKHTLEDDLVPRTSPTCRATFCGPGCGLSAAGFSSTEIIEQIDFDLNQVQLSQVSGDAYVDGQLRFLEGPQTGIPFGILSVTGASMTLDRPLSERVRPGTRAEIRQGCDHTFDTCSTRFNNAVNFRGEPFLPGNDLLARYGQGGG